MLACIPMPSRAASEQQRHALSALKTIARLYPDAEPRRL
jgi:hypothetical protein